MLFVQPFFLLLFLPAAVGVFYLTRRLAGSTAALGVIVVASAIFYAPYGVLPFAILATSLCVNLLIGLALVTQDHGKSTCRVLLTVGLLADFGNLLTFKYLDPIASLTSPAAQPILSVAIPAGISFYTFHQAVFLVHAFNRQEEVVTFLSKARGAWRAVVVFIRYSAFVAFFPQLVIGPITYLSEFGPQIERPGFGKLRWSNLQVGITLVVAGLFKKVVIADSLATLGNPLFKDLATGVPISREQAVLAIASYFFQLYFDFSGYSDMALGIARLFGLRLPMNFDSPLRATGIIDFYRRWHMTLTRVIVLFVFTPLSLWGARFAIGRGLRGWRERALRAWAPFLATFQIIALWHAAKPTFMVFGLIHGVWYILETEVRASKGFKRFRSTTPERARTLGGVALTLIPLALTFALFRSENLHAFWALLQTLGGATQPPAEAVYINRRTWLGLGAVALMVYALPNIYEVLRNYRPAIHTFDNRPMTPSPLRVAWRPNLVWALFVFALAACALVKLNMPSPFLYAGF